MASSRSNTTEKLLPVCRMITQAGEKEKELETHDKEVSSKAIIKSSGQNMPAVFIELEEETNLNIAPASQLCSGISGSFTNASFKRKSLDYSSFVMAYKYPDTVGEVDVISDAEHIKKLLKIPFSSDSELSMVVHRIGKTLLFSDFDVPTLLNQLSPKGYGSLNWLRDFYSEASGVPTRSHFTPEERNQEQAMIQNLLSAYLEHSAAAGRGPSTSDLNLETLSLENPQPCSELEKASLSNLLPQTEQQNSSSSQPRPEPSFQREFLWNFEDLTMLVGSEMPIFGGGKYPVVSLRLRDATTPINILTGLDYWLDNLMCNVPEVVMCFHVKGIVKKYEIVKTEDLPKLEGSRFSPKVIKDVAQNILSFLKGNCTKEGHTYWLFKGGKDDVVKLYDLTSICSERTNDTSQNPFTVAVGTLLYRVARNMVNSGETSERNIETIKTLLCKCLLLLDRMKYPEITHSANLLLADLFLSELNEENPDEMLLTQPKIQELEQFDEDAPTYSEDESDRWESDAESCSTKFGDTNGSTCSDSGPQEMLADGMVTLSKEERYRKVVYHVVQALRCHQEYPLLVEVEKATVEPVQTSYGKTPDSSSVDRAGLSMDVAPRSASSSPEHSASQKMWRLTDEDLISLFQKLTQAYCRLAEVSIRKAKYGRALKFLKIGLICRGNYSTSPESNEQLFLRAKLLMFLGDVCFFLARCNDDCRLAHKEEFMTLNPDDQYVTDVCGDVNISEFELNALEPFGLLEEKLFLIASGCYEKSLELYPAEADDDIVNEVIETTGRLGNVRNELGVYYMNCAANCTRGFGNPQAQEQELWKKSYGYLEKGIKAFEVVANKQNIALLYSNAGRLMRLCAHVSANSTKSSADTERGPFSQEEKMYYNKAFEFYERAFSALGVRSTNSDIWDKVTDEIAGTYFAMASVLQDYSPYGHMSEEQVMKEVLSLMMKSLHHYEELSNQSGTVSSNVQKRIGNIHYRIASLYHHWIRHQGMDPLNKKYRTLADKHYEKACVFLTPEKFPCDYLRCLVERNGLRLRSSQHTQNATLLFKMSLTSLDTIVSETVTTSLKAVVSVLDETAKAPSESEGKPVPQRTNIMLATFNTDVDDFNSILDLLDIQLCDCLKEILRLHKTKQSNKSTFNSLLAAAVAKKMYEVVLRSKSMFLSEGDNISDIASIVFKCTRIFQTIEQLCVVRASH